MSLQPDDDKEMMASIRTGMATASFNRWAGFEVTHASTGRVELRMRWKPETMGQYSGFLHAGLIAALLDTACGAAAVTAIGPVLASHFAMNCLSPAIGDEFIATGWIVKAGKRQVFAAAELRADQGDRGVKLVATGDAILIPSESGSTSSTVKP